MNEGRAAAGSGERGCLFVLAAPSGAGKTSLVNALIESEPQLRFSVSHTTRSARRGEEDGVNYFFIERGEFAEMVAAGLFLEHAEVFDNLYGTSRVAVETLLGQGFDVLLEIDWQGAAQVRRAMPDSLSIFILPPGRDELERRLRSRATDSESVIQRRLRDSTSDMQHWAEFDYVIINDDFDRALAELRDVVHRGGAASRSDRPELPVIVDRLLDNSDQSSLN
ncbi:MAG: guanylate kinase [Gammaproteobacteria bacterium]|nr:guanylate kinase [Gammaproteobacteria bacterium]